MQELQGLEIDFAFDGDTQYIDGNPIVVFGETYRGSVLLRNSANYQYLILDVTADDPDIRLEMKEKYVMPGETRIIPFEIATKSSRKNPIKMGVSIHGGYLM